MAKSESNSMGISSDCSNGAHKRLLQQDSSGSKKKPRISMRTDYTYAPYHDGFQWRKYGQKMIRGNAFPRGLIKTLTNRAKPERCYYRCTYHHDLGCPASKHVEQHNSGDSPLFRVVYTNEHTCSAAADAASDYMASSMQIQQIADASLRKVPEVETKAAPLTQLARCGRGFAAAIKEEKDAIVSSLLTVIRGCDDGIVKSDHSARVNYSDSLMATNCYTGSPAMARGSHEGSSSSSVSPVVLPAHDDLGLEFMVESNWFEPLDLGWFIE
uniref:Uncharacterized protein n=1 Tax=Avena sativa TaxID=4498 RepID=A0ACD5W3Y7_AVESA